MTYTYFYPSGGAENSFIYLLTGVLFLLALLSFVKSRFDILHPVTIYHLCLAGCCSLAAMYTELWDLPMHFNTAMILIVMSLLFFAGGVLAEYHCAAFYPGNAFARGKSFAGFPISWPVWWFFFLAMVLILYVQCTVFLEAVRQVTNATDLGGMLHAVVKASAAKQIEFDRWHAYRLRFANMMAYVSILAVWLNLLSKQYKETAKWSVFVLLYIPFLVMTGGRQQFMYVAMFGVVTFFLLSRKRYGGISLRRELAVIGLAVVFFLFFFLGIGMLNGKVGANTSFLNVIVHYAGTNISAFDVYINEMVMDDTPYIGTRTFCAIYDFLHDHGLDVPQDPMYIYLFTALGPVTTNVYTAFYRYIHDFGYLGCGMVMLLLGFFYTYIYRRMYLSGLKNWMILLYGSISFPIFLMGREERFFNEIVNTRRASLLAGILMLYVFFEYLNKRRRKSE